MDLSKGYWRRKGVEAQVTLSSALLGRWLRLFQRLLGSCSRNWSREKAVKCFKVCKNTPFPATHRGGHQESSPSRTARTASFGGHWQVDSPQWSSDPTHRVRKTLTIAAANNVHLVPSVPSASHAVSHLILPTTL